MRFFTTPHIFRLLYPSLIWEMPKGGKKIYLTFDDGPHPVITPKVLELLKEFDAKATFFCVGKNAEKYKDTFDLIIKEGHTVGNHTYNHENGWNTSTRDYAISAYEADELIDSVLFRPPHGRITPAQIKILKEDFKLIAWTVISYDWDKSLSPDECFNNVIKHSDDGSIIVFHDSEKAVNNMIPTLRRVLEYYSEKGYSFEKL